MQRLILLILAVAAACAPPPAVEPRPGPAPTTSRQALPPSSVVSGARLRIIATNDFHGALFSRPDGRGVVRGGGAYLATMAERLAASCPQPCETLLLDGGDMFQGTPASNLAWGRPVVQLFNAMGYAAAALGNHEFDWGQDTLRARMRQAQFAILGANVRDLNGRDVEWIRNDTIVVRGQWRVGIIGIARVKTPEASYAANVAGLRFDPPAPIVDSIGRALRARGANAIVVIAHEGAFCDREGCKGEIVDLANQVTEPLDAIVSGHTHSLVDAVIRNIPIVQARSRGTAIATIDLVRGHAVADADRGRVHDVLPESLPASPAARDIVTAAFDAVASTVFQKVAIFAVAMPREGNQHALGNFIADAQRVAGKSDIAVMNNGGIRAGLEAGPAVYGSLYEVQPFANALVRKTVSGLVLREYFERLVGGDGVNAHVSGVTVEFDPARRRGARITSLRLDGGRTLDDKGTYTVTLSDFLAGGGDRLGFDGRESRTDKLAIVDLDALIAYARAQPQPIRPPTAVRLSPVSAK